MLRIIFLIWTHSKSWEEPAQPTEDESLDKTDDVEKSPALDCDAVAGEEDGDGAIHGDGESEDEEPAAVTEAHAVVDVGAVMVKLGNTPVTNPRIIIC